MNRHLMVFILLFSRIIIQADGKAPSDSSRRYKYACAGFSAVAYQGSLESGYNRWTPAYHAGILLEKRKFFSSFVGFGFGSYTAEDRSYRLPAKADQTLLPVAAVDGSFFTLHYEARLTLFRYKALRIQACQGAGMFRFSVTDRNGNNLSGKTKSRALGESYSDVSFFFPSSLMLHYAFPNRIGLGFQAGWFNPVTSYLDNMNQLSLNNNSDNLAAFRFHFFMPLN
jgi:hypothetical protein